LPIKKTNYLFKKSLKMRSLIILMLAFLCLFQTELPAQPLETKVTLNYQQVRLAKVLADIKSKYGVGFSYANNLIPLDKKMNLAVTDKPLGQALTDLFKETGISFTLVGGQVVLRKGAIKPKRRKPLPKPVPNEKTEIGSVPKNEESDQNATASLLPVPELSTENTEGEPIDKQNLTRDFQIEKKNLQKNYLSQMDVAMENNDSAMASNLQNDFQRLNQKLKKQFRELVKSAKEVDWKSVFKTSGKDSVQKSKGKSLIQVSFVPPMSTNGSSNANTTNNLSLNILAGYSGGLEGIEVGSLANVIKGNVTGVQVSGLVNVVKQDVKGVQVASFLKTNGGRLEGAQVAGFLNASKSDSSNAVQIAGFGNLNAGDLYGGQVSGYFNVNNGYLIGPQVSGFINVNNGPILGAQAAGFLNINNGNLNGAQVAGFMNIASKNVQGSQVAGFINVSGKNINGVQVAGFLNRAKNVRGSQVGVINIADSVSGVQVGLFSFSRNGYRRLEVFGMENLHSNLAFKIGSKKFHNIFTVGINPFESSPRWSYGYGFGSEFDLGKNFNLNLDLVCNQVQENSKKWNEDLNLLNQFKCNFGYHPGKRTTIFAGPTINVAVSKVKNAETGAIGLDMIPDWNFMNELYTNTRVGIWAGFNAGVRF